MTTMNKVEPTAKMSPFNEYACLLVIIMEILRSNLTCCFMLNGVIIFSNNDEPIQSS